VACLASRAAIERHLLEVVTPDRYGAARDPDDDFRISLAGAQEKDAFLRWNGRWMTPRGATPTTHIFKLLLGLVGRRQADISTSVDNEWLCLKLLGAYGLPVPDAQIATFGSQRVLVVERFDRTVSADGQRLLRLMQEDFCLATGTSPWVKYEAEGGPGHAVHAAAAVRRSAARPAHADGRPGAVLAAARPRRPRQELQHPPAARRPLPAHAAARRHVGHPVMGDGPNQWSPRELCLAMALVGKNRHYEVDRIQRRHFNSTARRCGYGHLDGAEPLLQDLIGRTPAVIEQVGRSLPEGFSQYMADTVLAGLQRAAEALDRMPAG
jgi:serine/threonine-protein kinase HipA